MRLSSEKQKTEYRIQETGDRILQASAISVNYVGCARHTINTIIRIWINITRKAVCGPMDPAVRRPAGTDGVHTLPISLSNISVNLCHRY